MTAGQRRSSSTSTLRRTPASSRPSRLSSTSSYGPCATESAALSSKRAREIFANAEKAGLHLALAELPAAFFGDPWGTGGTVTALRSVLMKPEHRGALGTIGRLLSDSTGGAAPA